MAFDMSKPYLAHGSIKFENRYCKGYGMMIGLCVGYEYQFCEQRRSRTISIPLERKHPVSDTDHSRRLGSGQTFRPR